MHSLGSSFCLLALIISFVVQAAPAPGKSFELLPREAHGPFSKLVFLPRDPKNEKDSTKGNGTKATDVGHKKKQDKKEKDLVTKIQEALVKNTGNNKKKDEVRKDVFKKKTKQKNTVIIVVQVVKDVRQGGKNANTRYIKHSITANNNQNATQTVQVTDAQAMTISNATVAASDAAANNNLAEATGSAPALLALQTAAVDAPFNFANQTVLEASGAPAPSWTDVQADPAAALVTGTT